jgi:hypothetical protein
MRLQVSASYDVTFVTGAMVQAAATLLPTPTPTPTPTPPTPTPTPAPNVNYLEPDRKPNAIPHQALATRVGIHVTLTQPITRRCWPAGVSTTEPYATASCGCTGWG